MKIYQVGGSVRDELLGIVPKDYDYVVVGATESDMIARGFRKIEATSFPVFLGSLGEYALARRETKTGPGYHGFKVEFGPDVTLEEDLRRRDFTINAIAKDPATGIIIDPIGGVQDLYYGILKACNDSAFHEDPVRVLRLAKFVSRLRDFSVSDSTLSLAKKASLELSSVPGERIYKELVGILIGIDPEKGLNILSQIGALRTILPEVDNMRSAEQDARYHPEGSAYNHTMMVLSHARRYMSPGTEDSMVLFGALFHDIGKVGKFPHLGHPEIGADMIPGIAKRICLPRMTAEFCRVVCLEHMRAHRVFEMRDSKKIGMYERVKKFGYTKFLDVVDADLFGRLLPVDLDFIRDRRLVFDTVKEAIEDADFSKVQESADPKSMATQIKIDSFRRAWSNKENQHVTQ